MEEIWKEIKGYEGYYEVSNTGHVRSLTRSIAREDGSFFTRKGRPKAEMLNKDGYLVVKLSKGNYDKNIPIHILVAKNFIEDKDYSDGWEVNHKDAVRTNNCVDNLEWVTRQGNIAHAVAMGHMKRYGERNPNYGNDTLKKKFQEHPELRTLQARKGAQNGRCVAVSMTDTETGETKSFNYLRDCARYLVLNGGIKAKNIDGIANRITASIKTGDPYEGYTFNACSN